MSDQSAVARETDALLERGIAALYATVRPGRSHPLASAVPILDRWTEPALDGPDDAELPVLRVSPRRPDVGDLGRVMALDRTSAGSAGWRAYPGHGSAPERIGLVVVATRPVRVSFLVAFTLPRDRWLLDVTERGRSLALSNGPRDTGPLLVIMLSGASLAALTSCRDAVGRKAG